MVQQPCRSACSTATEAARLFQMQGGILPPPPTAKAVDKPKLREHMDASSSHVSSTPNLHAHFSARPSPVPSAITGGKPYRTCLHQCRIHDR